MLYGWTQKCTVSRANQLRAVADVFRPQRTHQCYWTTERCTSHKWSLSNRYYTACGENRKYISEHKKNAHNGASRALALNGFYKLKCVYLYINTLYIHIHTYTHTCICTYLYIHIYTLQIGMRLDYTKTAPYCSFINHDVKRLTKIH